MINGSTHETQYKYMMVDGEIARTMLVSSIEEAVQVADISGATQVRQMEEIYRKVENKKNQFTIQNYIGVVEFNYYKSNGWWCYRDEVDTAGSFEDVMRGIDDLMRVQKK